MLTFQTNVMGTVHVMEAVRRTPSVRSVVIVTTDKCYENREWPWAYREDDTLGGYDPVQLQQSLRRIGRGSLAAILFSGVGGEGGVHGLRARR